METVNLNLLAYFAAVVEAGSFTRAAERLAITKTVVSQQVARLEKELNTSLLVRTTRRVAPTEAGRLLHARCVMILREAEAAVGEIAQSNAEPMGLLRVAGPNDYGASTVAPLAARFARANPRCTVDLVLSDMRLDLIANKIDVSVRVGWLDDSSLQARRIGSFRQLLVATPELAQSIKARTPADLAGQPFIANGALRDPLEWQFTRSEGAKGQHQTERPTERHAVRQPERQTVRMTSTLAINATPAVLAAALAGGGMAVLPDFVADEHIRSGRLRPLLRPWSLPSGGIHVVFPPARFRPPKVKAFVDMLARHVNQSPGKAASS